jgi:hypothetical protein
MKTPRKFLKGTTMTELVVMSKITGELSVAVPLYPIETIGIEIFVVADKKPWAYTFNDERFSTVLVHPGMLEDRCEILGDL